MYEIIQEGKAKIKAFLTKKISREMPVFYNPAMKFNRDISILLLNSIEKKGMQIGSPLAGSGVREARMFLELKKGRIKKIDINDISKEAVSLIKENLMRNCIKSKTVSVFNDDANLFLLNSAGYDYIDIDPWGTPNPFLDCAIKRLARGGILAVTATDTSALSGTYPDACMRKYWALPKKDEMMHETGLRILIRKIQLIGAHNEKALTPIFSYSKEHYMRVFLSCEKSKKAASKILNQHGMFNGAGPLWLGRLWDKNLAEKMQKNNKIGENSGFLEIITKESEVSSIGFYHIHKLCKRHKRKIPRKQELIERIRSAGYKAEETHFNPESIRSDIGLNEFISML